MVSALDYGSSRPGSSLGLGRFVAFLSKIIYFCSASRALCPGAPMATQKQGLCIYLMVHCGEGNDIPRLKLTRVKLPICSTTFRSTSISPLGGIVEICSLSARAFSIFRHVTQIPDRKHKRHFNIFRKVKNKSHKGDLPSKEEQKPLQKLFT